MNKLAEKQVAFKVSDFSGTIGKHDQTTALPAYYFKGSLDDFKYWNKSLSSLEVLELYSEQTLVTSDISNSGDSTINYKKYHNKIVFIDDARIIKAVVYNQLGQEMIDIQQETIEELDITNLSQGLYYIKILNEKGLFKSIKFIK